MTTTEPPVALVVPLPRARRKRPRRSSWRRSRSAYLFLAPAVLSVVGLIGFCMAFTVNTTFYRWNGVGPGAEGVGIANYTRMLTDPTVGQSVVHMGILALLIPVPMFIGLVFAALLHSPVRGKPLYKSLLFLPVVLSPALMAPTFRALFAADGTLNQALSAVGLESVTRPWLADPATALPALMVITVWSSTGFSFLLYYAALTSIEPEMLEAARIDGASNTVIFFRFLVPLTAPTSATLVLLGVIAVVKTFDLPYIMTAGGPAHATEFLSTYLFTQSVKNFNAGYAATLSVLLVVICVTLALAQIRITRNINA